MLAKSTADDPRARERIAEMERRWREAATHAERAEQEVEEALGEILHSRADTAFSPEPYRADLERLGGVGSDEPPAKPREGFTPDSMRAHAALICGAIATGEPVAARRCPGLFRLIAASAGTLIEQGRLDLLLNVAAAARNCSDADAAAPGARALLDTIGRPERIELLVREARTGDAAAARAAMLLRLAGPPALTSLAKLAGGYAPA
jgi:hypothetical protein